MPPALEWLLCVAALEEERNDRYDRMLEQLSAEKTKQREEKRQKEIKSLWHINDSFRKILVQKEPVLPYYDNNGFLNLSLLDFLTDETVIDK